MISNIKVGDEASRAKDVLGRVYDPCCGSSGMFVQSVEFIKAHAKGNGNGGKAKADISIYGQESNYTTWRLARMNLAIRGIDSGQIAQGDTFHNDRHPDLKADFILANPPFNISDWGDKRWQYGAPPADKANFGIPVLPRQGTRRSGPPASDRRAPDQPPAGSGLRRHRGQHPDRPESELTGLRRRDAPLRLVPDPRCGSAGRSRARGSGGTRRTPA